MEYFVKFFAYKALLAVFFFPLIVLFLLIPTPEKSGVFKIAYWTLGGLLLISLFGIPWLAHRATERHLHENEQFHEALRGSFSDARFHLGFLPFIGSLFRYRSKQKQSFEDSKPIE